MAPGGPHARGRALPEPQPAGQEGLTHADLDLGKIALAEAAADRAGHHARPDVTRRLIDRTPGERVVERRRQPSEVGRVSSDEPPEGRVGFTG